MKQGRKLDCLDNLSAEHWTGARRGGGQEKSKLLWCGRCLVVCFVFQRTAVDRNKRNAGLGDSSGLYLWSFPWRHRLFVLNRDAAGIFAPLMVVNGERWEDSSL